MTPSREQVQAYAALMPWLTTDPDNDNWAYTDGPPAVNYQAMYPLSGLSALGDTQASIDAYRTAKHAELAATTDELNALTALQSDHYGESWFYSLLQSQPATGSWAWTALWTEAYADDLLSGLTASRATYMRDAATPDAFFGAHDA